MTNNKLFFADRAQVVGLVPLEQQAHQLQQLLVGVRFEAELAHTAGELFVEARHRQRPAHAAVSRARPTPRLRCTSKREIAAGVTPEMRDAWPTVSGRCWLSFCWTSIESPRTS